MVQQARCSTQRHSVIRGAALGRRSPTNAKAESIMKTLKVEEVYLAGYEIFVDVAERCVRR